MKTASTSYAGACQYLSYYDGSAKVVITSNTPDANALNAGFGSSAHHDNSAHHNGDTLTLRYQGTHHAIFDWTQTIR